MRVKKVIFNFKVDEVKPLWGLLRDKIYNLVDEYYLEIGKALNLGLDKTLKTRYLQDVFNEKDASLNKIYPLETYKLARTKINFALEKTLNNLDSEHLQYIALLFEKVVYHNVLRQDAFFGEEINELLAKRTLFLNSDVILALEFSNHKRHKVVKELLKRTQELNIALVFSNITHQKLTNHLAKAKNNYSKLNLKNNKGVLELLSKLRVEEDIILYDYVLKHKEVSWDTFIEEYESWETYLKEKYAINLYTAHTEVDIEQQQAINLQQETVDLIMKERNENKADEFGSRVWGLTLDRDMVNSQSHKLFYKTIYDWGKYLLGMIPFNSSKVFDFENYLKGLIIFEFDLANTSGKGKITVDSIGALLAFEVPLEALNEHTFFVAERVLEKIVQSKELKKLLNDAEMDTSEKEEVIASLQDVFKRELVAANKIMETTSLELTATVNDRTKENIILQGTIKAKENENKMLLKKIKTTESESKKQRHKSVKRICLVVVVSVIIIVASFIINSNL